jgi:hypothetical protein
MDEEKKKKLTEEKKAAFLKDVLAKTYAGIAELNEEDAYKVLRKSCLACNSSAKSFMSKNYGYDFSKPDLDKYLAAEEKMEKAARDDRSTLTREGNTVTLEAPFHECICPLVLYKIVEPFPNLCLCGIDWGKIMLGEASGKPVKSAKLVDSVNRGGKSCRFRYELDPTWQDKKK